MSDMTSSWVFVCSIAVLSACGGAESEAASPTTPEPDRETAPEAPAAPENQAPTESTEPMGGDAARGNLQVLCEIVSDPTLGNQAPEHLKAMILDRVDRQIVHRGVRRAFEACWDAAPEQAYEIMRHAASEMGVPEWECPALDRLWRRMPAARECQSRDLTVGSNCAASLRSRLQSTMPRNNHAASPRLLDDANAHARLRSRVLRSASRSG